jgi:membrane protein
MFPPLRLREALSLGGLSVRELTVRTWKNINDHEIMTRAAAVAFYAMLALVPFLALVLTFTAWVLPDITGLTGRSTGIGNLTTEQLRATLSAFLPGEAYGVFADQIARLQSQKQPPLGVLLFSTAVTVWLASSLFVAIIDAMNRIYGVNETRWILKIRLTAVVMTFLQAAILIGALLAIVLWPQILGWFGPTKPAALLATLVQWALVTLMVLLSFALSFYVGPDADQKWEWITPGSLVGTVVFLLTCLGFRVYVQNFGNYDKTYGSLGGVMALMFWLWISALILLSAAEMNKVIEDASPLGRKYGQTSDPTDPLDLKAIAPQPAGKG